MGLDINAHLIVGLPVPELDIKQMPYYEEFTKQHGDEATWQDLGEFYWAHPDMPCFYLRSVHRDCDDPERIFGVEIAHTSSRGVHSMGQDVEEISTKLRGSVHSFKEKIGKEPRVYIMPRMW